MRVFDWSKTRLNPGFFSELLGYGNKDNLSIKQLQIESDGDRQKKKQLNRQTEMKVDIG